MRFSILVLSAIALTACSKSGSKSADSLATSATTAKDSAAGMVSSAATSLGNAATTAAGAIKTAADSAGAAISSKADSAKSAAASTTADMAASAKSAAVNSTITIKTLAKSPEHVKALQTALNDDGCSVGAVDGVVGAKTRHGIICSAKKHDVPATDLSKLAAALNVTF